jgi:hypothetical protein
MIEPSLQDHEAGALAFNALQRCVFSLDDDPLRYYGEISARDIDKGLRIMNARSQTKVGDIGVSFYSLEGLFDALLTAGFFFAFSDAS